MLTAQVPLNSSSRGATANARVLSLGGHELGLWTLNHPHFHTPPLQPRTAWETLLVANCLGLESHPSFFDCCSMVWFSINLRPRTHLIAMKVLPQAFNIFHMKTLLLWKAAPVLPRSRINKPRLVKAFVAGALIMVKLSKATSQAANQSCLVVGISTSVCTRPLLHGVYARKFVRVRLFGSYDMLTDYQCI